MPKGLFLAVMSAWLVLGATPAYADKAPHQIAGFALGDNISKYESNLNRASSWPVRYQEYLTEVDLNNVEGYKNGTLTYGACAHPGAIVRIKLKYDVSNRRFFEDLLTRYKEKFGDPDEWRGDPFQVIIAWKWTFRDARKHSISLILQHSMDDEQKLGNSVKLTDITLLDEERLCHEKKKAPETDQKKAGKISRKGRQEITDFRRFIPQ
ncbi:MAG: hypothetical protein ACM3MN_00130 [Nitrospirota bacterium]